LVAYPPGIALSSRSDTEEIEPPSTNPLFAERGTLHDISLDHEAIEQRIPRVKYASISAQNGPRIDLKALAGEMVQTAWNAGEIGAFNELIQKESGWNPHAVNPTSGACGLPQALPCSKIKDRSPEGQIRWAIQYIQNRYGTPTKALEFHREHNWY
jgi:hypothetical protein